MADNAFTLSDLPERFDEVIDDLHVLSLPMVTRFRGITEREVAIFSGPAGWAEFSPFVEYRLEEASRWLRAALEFAGLITEPTSPLAAPSVRSVSPDPAGTESAPAEAADLTGKAVAVNGTLPACSPSEVDSILARYGRVGTVKAKVAEHGLESLDQDLERLREFRRLFPLATLRLDANGGYSLDAALIAAARFAEFGLQYFEQPVASVEDMARLRAELDRRGLPIVLAADESIRKAEDPLRVAELGAAEVIIVKVQPLGGIGSARAVIDDCGLPAVVSSALESSVGLSAGAALAAGLPRTETSRRLLGDDPACGLGTVRLFADDIADPNAGMRPVGGYVPVTRIVPDPDRLQALAVGPGRYDWWSKRLQGCWTHLRTGGYGTDVRH